MFVFVKHHDELHVTVFGPATPAECRAWMRMKKLCPSSFKMSERLLTDENGCDSATHDDDGCGKMLR